MLARLLRPAARRARPARPARSARPARARVTLRAASSAPGFFPPPERPQGTWYLVDLRETGDVPDGWRVFTDGRADGGSSEAQLTVARSSGVRFSVAARAARETLRDRELYDREAALTGAPRFEDAADGGVPVLSFSGTLSNLKHAGPQGAAAESAGYAAIASPEYGPPMDWSGYDTLELRVRGDGRRYVFSVQSSSRFANDMHQGYVFTERARWITVRVPVAALNRVSGGRLLATQLEPSLEGVESFGLTAEGEPGAFRVDVGWVALLRSGEADAVVDVEEDAVM